MVRMDGGIKAIHIEFAASFEGSKGTIEIIVMKTDTDRVTRKNSVPKIISKACKAISLLLIT
jgi:hypothetical protein